GGARGRRGRGNILEKKDPSWCSCESRRPSPRPARGARGPLRLPRLVRLSPPAGGVPPTAFRRNLASPGVVRRTARRVAAGHAQRLRLGRGGPTGGARGLGPGHGFARGRGPRGPRGVVAGGRPRGDALHVAVLPRTNDRRSWRGPGPRPAGRPRGAGLL